MKKRFWLLPAALAALSVVAVPGAQAKEFYKGKTLTIIVGFSAGGGFDTYSRLIGRHLAKHIPGHPTVVVENKTGAGSLIAANYVYNEAPKDGTVIGNWIGPLVLQQVLGNKAAHFDGRKFGWLGAPVADAGTCVLTKASGITSVAKWFAAKTPVKIGGTAPGSNTDDVPKLVRAAIGLPLRIIDGYRGTAKIRLAAESGEIAGGCWAWQSIRATWAKAVESGEVLPILQTNEKSYPTLKKVPLAIHYAKTKRARELLDIANGPYSEGARPYSVPPGVPHARLELLQKAFMATLRDPALLRDAKKSKLDIAPVSGPAIAKMMASLYKMSPSLKDELRKLLIPHKR